MVVCSRFFVVDPLINFCMILHQSGGANTLDLTDPDFYNVVLIAPLMKWAESGFQ